MLEILDLDLVVVDPQYQGTGIASMLLKSFTEMKRRLPVYCEYNGSALPFCRKLVYDVLDSFSLVLLSKSQGHGEIYKTYCLNTNSS